AAEGRSEFPADLLGSVDPPPPQRSCRGLELGQGCGHGFAGDVGRNGRFAIAADAVTGPEPEEDVFQLVVLPGGDPERGDQRRPDYRRRCIIYYERYSFHTM